MVRNTWLTKHLRETDDDGIIRLFREISDFHETAILPEGELRALERAYSDAETHTPAGQMLGIVETAVLTEIAERYVALRGISSEDSSRRGTDFHVPFQVGDSIYLSFPKRPIETLTVNRIVEPRVSTVDARGDRAVGFYPSELGKYLFLSMEAAEEAERSDSVRGNGG